MPKDLDIQTLMPKDLDIGNCHPRAYVRGEKPEQLSCDFSLVTSILWNNRNGGWKPALDWHEMPWSWLRIWCLFRHRWSNWSNDPLTYHWLMQIVSWRQLWGLYTEDKPKITPIVVFVLMIQRSFSSWALAPTHFTICMRGWLILLFSFINEVGFSCQ